MSSVKSAVVNSPRAGVIPGVRATQWPLRDEPLHAMLGLGCCAAAGAFCMLLSHSVLMGLLAMLALTLAVWKLWVPVTVELRPLGIMLTIWQYRRWWLPWRDIDHVELWQRGVVIRPRTRSERAGVARALYMPWSRDREALVAFLQEYQPVPVENRVGCFSGRVDVATGPGQRAADAPGSSDSATS